MTRRAFRSFRKAFSSSNAENAETLWGFIGRYRPGVTPQTHPKLNAMVGYAINYYRDFVAPTKKFREPNDAVRKAANQRLTFDDDPAAFASVLAKEGK